MSTTDCEAAQCNTGLTAAECAARTGLTVRALRVYEEMGLIAPKRSAGGWRYYGAADLIRLNTITMLKVAGLTLAQIKTVTALSDKSPSLEHVLAVQIDTWKSKQVAAARGQATAEAALKNLRNHDALSIDELCNLVRSLELSDREHSDQGEVPGNDSDPQEIAVSAALLDKYVGHYRYWEYASFSITRDGTKLIAQLTGQPPHETIAQSDTEFFDPAANAYLRFVTDAQGRVTDMVILQLGMRVSLPRIEAAVANEMQARVSAKIASNSPTPGSDRALRRMLESIRAGAPNYNEMSAVLAELVRLQLPLFAAMSKYLGAIQALEFRGVGKAGWDVYDVRCEHGTSQWRIGVRADGIIDGAGPGQTDPRALGAFTPNERDSKQLNLDTHAPTPGAESALRRMIDGIRNGAPNYDEMSPLLAVSIKQQLPQLQAMGKQLGAMVAIEYQGTVLERFDIFDVKRENGAARWRISVTDDGKIRTATAMLTGQTLMGGP